MDVTIDLGAKGIHAGFIRVPYSSNTSAYGFRPVPIVSANGGDGPAALISAGIHGDEYEGPVLLTRLVQALSDISIKGRLIILPVLNVEAFRGGTRNSTVDEINLNRWFGGNSATATSDALAAFVEHELLSRVDFAIDLHSGGRSLLYGQQASVYRTEEGEPKDLGAIRHELAAGLGLPLGLIYKTRVGEGGSLLSAASRQGVAAVATELGGAAFTDHGCVETGLAAVMRLLAHEGVIADPGDGPAAAQTKFFRVHGMASCVFADRPGVWEMKVECGDAFEAGDTLGYLHNPQLPWEPSHAIRAQHAGTALAVRAHPLTEAGDCLVQFGTDG